jgi:hypothetical protein
MAKLIGIVIVLSLAACGGTNGNNNGSPDMAMAPAACVQNPTTSVELLNACTTAQSGDPAKDAPYFPSLAPGSTLPPLP